MSHTFPRVRSRRQDLQVKSDTNFEALQPLVSALPAGRAHRRAALGGGFLVFFVFFCTLPFARIAGPSFPGFVLIQQTLLLANELITAALLFVQYAIGRTRSLAVLASGYLFTALMAVPHALTFPGAFSETGLLGAGPQSAAWLYIGWHAVLPLTAIVFALRRDHESPGRELPGAVATAILVAALAAVSLVAAMTLLVTAGQAWLPALIESGAYTTAARIALGVLLVLPLGAMLTLARRQRLSVLDLWLMVVMFAWLCNFGLGAFVSSGRYDVGWYVGRVFDWLTSLLLLLIFLGETTALYARNVRATALVLLERERRLKEMEAVLVHLSRVNELGKNVSSLVHEVSQP